MTAAVCGLITATAHAQTPYPVDWTSEIGTSAFDVAEAIAVDGAGNTLITGSTTGAWGGPYLGLADAFLTKVDPAGNFLWARQIATTGGEIGQGVAADSLGNAYVTGSTDGNLGAPNAGFSDIFLNQTLPDGTPGWSRQIGSGGLDRSWAVTTDATDHVYIAGSAGGPIVQPLIGGSDLYYAKFDNAGNTVWERQLGTDQEDSFFSIAVDAAGNTYLGGRTRGALEGTNAGGHDAFVMKIDPAGTVHWVDQFGTGFDDHGRSVALDADGNVYFNGFSRGAIGGPSAGLQDAFLVKYDNDGNQQWVRQAGTSTAEFSYDLAVDGDGNAYLTGRTEGALEGTNAGGVDAFIIKYDTDGNALWSEQFGTAGLDEINGVTLDSNGDLYVAGTVGGSLSNPQATGNDALIIKYNVPEPGSLAILGLGAGVVARRRRR